MIRDLNRILTDIDNAVYCRSFYFHDGIKYFLVNELKAKFSLFKFHKTAWTPRVYDALCEQIDYLKNRIVYSEKLDYIYLQIEAVALYFEKSYKLYNYCERRMQWKTHERQFLFECISNVHTNIEERIASNNDFSIYARIRKEDECSILFELLISEQPNKIENINIYRMLNNLKRACEKSIEYEEYEADKDRVTAYTELLEQEIKKQWDMLCNS